ncbi:alpha/beta hydrolase [Tropicimonas sediminicola]|nr:alpha/beta fold hydrolase [Tropicimonas sediminicola]
MARSARSWTEADRSNAVPTESQPIPLVVASPGESVRGTVLLVHGRNGAPDQPHIAQIAEAYLARDWRVVAPGLPNSSALPGSGAPEKLTFTGHCKAASAVWGWVRERWPDTPLALAGHSIGAFAVAHLAAETPGPHHVLAVSPAVSGRALLLARVAMGPPAVEAVEREAPLFRAEMEAADAAPALAKTDAPLAVVTGAEDGLVPLKDARAYFAAAANARFFAAVPGQHHCPVGPDVGEALTAALSALEASA